MTNPPHTIATMTTDAAAANIAHKVNPPKTRKGKKILEARDSLLVENEKKTVLMKGAKTRWGLN